jgi:NADPH2:quinone reductase
VPAAEVEDALDLLGAATADRRVLLDLSGLE